MSSDTGRSTVDNAEPESARKRRKIRKGTTSCWECKRRKVRCSLVDNPGSSCASCQRRGRKCVTQDLPEDVGSTVQPVDNRIGRVEALVGRLIQQTPLRTLDPYPVARGVTDSPHPSTSENTPAVSVVRDARSERISDPSVVRGQSLELDLPVEQRHQDGPSQSLPRPTILGAPHGQHQQYAKISQALYASLPPREDIIILGKAGAHVSILFQSAMMTSYPDLKNNSADGLAGLANVPSPESHPAQLARYIFRVVTVLQHLDFKKSGKHIVALSDAPQTMLRRLAETAMRLVTIHDELLNSVEGLECVIMEGNYHINCGNLRPAWIAIRRAMALAQLMGMHRPGNCSLRLLDQSHKVDPSFLWYRIVYADRLLCLPQGSMDRRMAAEASSIAETHSCQLERLHCVIASRILERNDADSATYKDTMREIDLALQKAAETMPSGWWVTPNLSTAEAPAKAADDDRKAAPVFWEMLRLVTQLHHYGLVVQLHIPFMLRFTDAVSLPEYSQTACVHASREFLSRYIVFRSFNRVAFSCRVVDFFALTAAVVLLVAHIREHARDELNFMAHQRPADRAILAKALANLQEVGWVTMDTVTAKAADLLSRLLDVEAEAAKGRAYTMQSVCTSDEATGADNSAPANTHSLLFRIPHFGIIRILPEDPGDAEPDTVITMPDSFEHDTPTAEEQHRSETAHEHTQSRPEGGIGSWVSPSQPWYAYPGASTEADNWALPSADMAFFGSSMQGPTMPWNRN